MTLNLLLTTHVIVCTIQHIIDSSVVYVNEYLTLHNLVQNDVEHSQI